MFDNLFKKINRNTMRKNWQFREENIKMEDCIFGKIASGEIQGLRIYENEEDVIKSVICEDASCNDGKLSQTSR